MPDYPAIYQTDKSGMPLTPEGHELSMDAEDECKRFIEKWVEKGYNPRDIAPEIVRGAHLAEAFYMALEHTVSEDNES